jgi:hypothetical protein
MLGCLIYWFYLLIVIFWLEILGERAYLSLHDLVGGQFWRNKPSFSFHGDWIPQVGCQVPTFQMREMNLWRPRRWLERHDLSLTCQMFCIEEAKNHLLEAWRHAWGGLRWWWIHMECFEGRNIWIMKKNIGLETHDLWSPNPTIFNSTFGL